MAIMLIKNELRTGHMLDVNTDTVCFLIQKARAFHVKESVSIPEEPLSSSDDWALQVLANHRGSLSFSY